MKLKKVLTAQLRQMEESGLLTRTVCPEVPPHVEYTLMELGCSLKPILDAMWTWGGNLQAEAGVNACCKTQYGADARK